MAYKDKAKQQEYQRDWVRQKRNNVSNSVEPCVTDSVEPLIPRPITKEPIKFKPEPQSHNPMKVGYVPPID